MSLQTHFRTAFGLRPAVSSATFVACLCAALSVQAQSLTQTMANTRPTPTMVTPPLAPPVRLSDVKQVVKAMRSDMAEAGQTLVQAVSETAKTHTVKPAPKLAAVSRAVLLSEHENNANKERIERNERSERAVRLGELSRLLELPAVLTMEPSKNAAAVVAAETSDLKTAARLGLANSLDVEAARYRLQTFGHTRDAARGALLPRADARFAVGRGTLASVEPHLSSDRKEYTATLRQALLDEPARREWTRQGVLTDSAELQMSGAASNALLESAGAWLAVLQARVSVQLGIEYTTLLDELSRYITERAAAGGASPADRERVRGRVANVRASMADANAALKVATRNLTRLTGTAPSAIALSFPASEFAVPAERETARELALAQNFELLAARAEIIASEVERDVARSRFLPRVELELTHSRTTNSGGQDNYSRDTRGMVVVSVPLANGGADLAQVRAATSRRSELQAKESNVERKLSQELETAYANLEASGQRYSAVRDELEANAKVVAAFRAQMLGSNRSLLEVLDAFQRLHQSRLDLTQSLVSEAQSQLRVAHLTGSLATVFSAAP
jgi:outer membrane protein TolC